MLFLYLIVYFQLNFFVSLKPNNLKFFDLKMNFLRLSGALRFCWGSCRMDLAIHLWKVGLCFEI